MIEIGADPSMLDRSVFVIVSPLPDVTSDSFLSVSQPGSIKVDLTEGCWGHVNVCVEGKCGGVRNDTWLEEKSKSLCKNLGCGTAIAFTESPNGKSEVIVESLHTFLPANNFNRSVVVLSQIQPKSRTIQPNHHAAYVVCSGNESMCTREVSFVCFFRFCNRCIKKKYRE